MIRKVFLILTVSFLLAAFIARLEHIRIITTDSAAPNGIYHMVAAPLARGALVLACLPPDSARLALQRGYLAGGNCPGSAEPVAKMVGAVAGDTVQLDRDFVAINGARIPNSPTLPRDSMGRPLEHATWRVYEVAPGEVWLFGFNNPHSWDARFFAGIPSANVLGALKPIITW